MYNPAIGLSYLHVYILVTVIHCAALDYTPLHYQGGFSTSFERNANNGIYFSQFYFLVIHNYINQVNKTNFSENLHLHFSTLT